MEGIKGASNGRGKKIFEAHLSEWTGQALMCDAYAGYLYCRNYESVDRACIMYSLFGACKLLGKNPEHWLTYVLKHIDTTPKEELHKLLPEEWEEA